MLPIKRRAGLSKWTTRLLIILAVYFILRSFETTPKSTSTIPTNSETKFITEFYHPTCPAHPTLSKFIKYPYNHIPNGIRSKSQVLCKSKHAHPKSSSQSFSQVRYYPADVYEYDNVMVDFWKRSINGDYSHFQPGFISSSCSTDGIEVSQGLVDWAVELKQSTGMQRFLYSNGNPVASSLVVDDAEAVSSNADIIIDDPVIILMRDDCGNTWHSLADFLHVYSSELIVGVDTKDFHVMVMDHRTQVSGDPDDIEVCPYHGASTALGRLGVLRAKDYQNKKVFFKKLVVVADQYQMLGIAWSVSACDGSEIVGKYVNNLFDYFKFKYSLNNVIANDKQRQLDQIIHITISSRRKKPFGPANGKIGRAMKNENELIEALKKIPFVKVKAVEFFELEFKDQLVLFQNTDILLGMHGAGLTNMIYTPLDAAIIELIPFTWRTNLFYNLAQLIGKKYYEWQNPYKKNHEELEGCDGFEDRLSKDEPNICATSTSVTTIDIPEVLNITLTAVNEVRKRRGWALVKL